MWESFFIIFRGEVHDNEQRLLRLLRLHSHTFISLPGPVGGHHHVDVARVLSPPRECRILLGVVLFLTRLRPDHPDELMTALLVHGLQLAPQISQPLSYFFPNLVRGAISSTFHVYSRLPANVASSSALSCFFCFFGGKVTLG